MGFIALTDAEIAPDKPVSNDLLKKVKDNFDDHEARILSGSGGGGSGGIGEVLNGSFESDSDLDGIPDNWTRYLYPGGSGAIDTADYAHGKKAYKLVHPGGVGNGGGYLESDYISVSHLFLSDLPFAYKASAAGTKVQVIARYFAADGSGNPGTYLGERVLWTYTNNPTRWYGVTLTQIPISYTNARYVKYRLIGGHYDTNVAGSVWFDGVGVDPKPARQPLSDAINQPQVSTWSTGWTWVGSTWTVTVPTSQIFRWLAVQVEARAGSYWDEFQGTVVAPANMRFVLNNNQVYSMEFRTSSYTAFDKGYCYGDISGLAPGTHSLRFQARMDSPYLGLFRSQNLVHWFGVGGFNVNAYLNTTTEVYG
jgi:hypothetical protein